MLKNKIIYGNIITLDDKDTIAEAMYIQDGKIAAVGSRKKINKYKNSKTLVLDYGNNSIYPGFMDAHMHGAMAATQDFGYIDLSSGKTIKDYVDIMRKYIAKHPGQKTYVGTNWLFQNLKTYPTKKDLDAIKTDAMIYMMTEDKHMLWVNSKVLRKCNITKKIAKRLGPDHCRVFKNGEPSGIFTDSPAMSLITSIEWPVDERRKGYIAWQNHAFSLGYTAVVEAAAIENELTHVCSSYSELVDAGIWKLRTYAAYMVQPSRSNWKKQISHIKECKRRFDSEYFNIYGVKLFEDGVVEAHTAWMLDDYDDRPGNKGKPIITNKDQLIKVISRINRNDLPVHVHSIGDAATKFVVDAIEQSQKKTGIKNARNTIAHLEIVDKKDFARIGKNHIIACVAPLWCPSVGQYIKTEIGFIGKERSKRLFPVKSFINAKALTVFHSDYPSTHLMSIPETIFRAVTRYSSKYGIKSIRNPQEVISRKQALHSMTRNVAYSFKQEKRMGTIEEGKIANFTIFNTNFLTCKVSDIAKAKIVNTIVDGEIVY